MARYKHIDRNPKFIPVVLDAQLMAGSFEYALDYLIDHELDLSRYDTHYKNDDTGALWLWGEAIKIIDLEDALSREEKHKKLAI